MLIFEKNKRLQLRNWWNKCDGTRKEDFRWSFVAHHNGYWFPFVLSNHFLYGEAHFTLYISLFFTMVMTNLINLPCSNQLKFRRKLFWNDLCVLFFPSFFLVKINSVFITLSSLSRKISWGLCLGQTWEVFYTSCFLNLFPENTSKRVQ